METERRKTKGEKIMTIKKALAAFAITVMIAVLMAVAGTHLNARGGGASAPQLEGSWEVTVTPTGGDPVIDFSTMTEGGGLISTDPDPNVSTGIGTWEKIGPKRFAVTFVHFLSDHGAPLGTLKVRAEVTLDNQTDTFSGPFRTDVIIGGNVVQSICGTVHAKRISAEPIEPCP
jgi:hypothetical protein